MIWLLPLTLLPVNSTGENRKTEKERQLDTGEGKGGGGGAKSIDSV
jgi:hypothetical protein